MEVKELKEGETYFFKTAFDWIVEFTHTDSNRIYGKASINKTNSSYSRGRYQNIISLHKEIRLGTPEEKHWLEICIKEDKFISKEEALKSFKAKIQIEEGKYYYWKGAGYSNEYIDKAGEKYFNTHRCDYINIKTKYFGKSKCSGEPRTLREATSEERQWLDACIKAGKFIEKEIALAETPKEERRAFERGVKNINDIITIKSTSSTNTMKLRDYYIKVNSKEESTKVFEYLKSLGEPYIQIFTYTPYWSIIIFNGVAWVLNEKDITKGKTLGTPEQFGLSKPAEILPVKNKWYHVHCYNAEYYVKYNDTWEDNEYITIKTKSFDKDGSFKSNTFKIIKEIDISEIQEYLPEGHPDKIISKLPLEGRPYSDIPEYVECIKRDSKLEVGKIYKCHGIYNSIYHDCYRVSGNNCLDCPYYITNFKPTTKEAYDAQFTKTESTMKKDIPTANDLAKEWASMNSGEIKSKSEDNKPSEKWIPKAGDYVYKIKGINAGEVHIVKKLYSGRITTILGNYTIDAGYYRKATLSEISGISKPEVWVPQVGEYAYILGIGHTLNNRSFPKGECFKIKSVSPNSDNKYYIYVEEGSNPKVHGNCTNSGVCRKATSSEIEALNKANISYFSDLREATKDEILAALYEESKPVLMKDAAKTPLAPLTSKQQEEYLKQARKLYPPGTMFESTGGGGTYCIPKKVKFEWDNYSSPSIKVLDLDSNTASGRVFNQSRGWAKVITPGTSSPSRREKDLLLVPKHQEKSSGTIHVVSEPTVFKLKSKKREKKSLVIINKEVV